VPSIDRLFASKLENSREFIYLFLAQEIKRAQKERKKLMNNHIVGDLVIKTWD
jgi:hypothetical protein